MAYDTPEQGTRAAELVRLPAVDGSESGAPLPEWARALVIVNPLDAIVFLRFDYSEASPGTPGRTNGYDVPCPGAAMIVHPIPSDVRLRHIRAAVEYPAAVPSADVGLVCTITVQEAAASPSVGPLA